MEGKCTIENGSYAFESLKSKPDPKRKGKILFDDCLNVYLKNKREAIRCIEILLQQIKEDGELGDYTLTFYGSLSFKKDD